MSETLPICVVSTVVYCLSFVNDFTGNRNIQIWRAVCLKNVNFANRLHVKPGLSREERDLSNRPDVYKTMGVTGEAIEHPFGLLHQWLTDLGMPISKNTLRNWLKKGKKYLDQLVCVFIGEELKSA